MTNYTDLPLDPAGDTSYTLDPADTDPLPDHRAEQSELRAVLSDALDQAEERYRAPAVLHFVHGLTHAEAAQRLGIPVGAAKSRVRYAARTEGTEVTEDAESFILRVLRVLRVRLILFADSV